MAPFRVQRLVPKERLTTPPLQTLVKQFNCGERHLALLLVRDWIRLGEKYIVLRDIPGGLLSYPGLVFRGSLPDRLLLKFCGLCLVQRLLGLKQVIRRQLIAGIPLHALGPQSIPNDITPRQEPTIATQMTSWSDSLLFDSLDHVAAPSLSVEHLMQTPRLFL
jgi:hypothetical protein